MSDVIHRNALIHAAAAQARHASHPGGMETEMIQPVPPKEKPPLFCEAFGHVVRDLFSGSLELLEKRKEIGMDRQRVLAAAFDAEGHGAFVNVYVAKRYARLFQPADEHH